ncbi:uncharacterized protein LOC101862265 isoform X1 [Aplysia californica]|uniref:Uncharacterized protein LOC101862265 isoform X1 n=1 Tax=Aplysia californica TaxID=6500 RepID=A0ABM1VRT2_APLCA|nr:uncharacterized protein LOC101862265 isoform X1 [Aplysia californica]XP_035825124.1 uncharacterized protein LOC101862265 isoform X1 [Aplysia californica]
MPKKIAVDTAEALITAIQKRECLYNARDACYRNRNVSELAWKAVSDEVLRDVPFCKATWASLRCTFNRNLASMRNLPSGSSADKQPKWHFFQHMLFLKDHVSNGQMTGNLGPHDDSQGNADDSTDSSEDQDDVGIPKIELDDSQFTLETVDTQLLTPSHTPNFLNSEEAGTSGGLSTLVPTASRTSTPRPSPAGKRQRTDEDPVQQAILEYIGSKRQRLAHEVEDEDLTFLRGLLPYFKNLPTMKKLQFMHQTIGFLMELNAESQ